MLTLKLFKKIYEISLKVHNKLFRSFPDRPPGLCNNRHVLVINVLFMEPRQYQKHNEVPKDKKIMYLHNLQKKQACRLITYYHIIWRNCVTTVTWRLLHNFFIWYITIWTELNPKILCRCIQIQYIFILNYFIQLLIKYLFHK